ncbi:putative conserved transmembrane transport protein [Pimelobacter simplex]|uniref:Putative conserved transmembrane transport protein n=2 Tax=Nocardioides simplex TaxID=2045 RepID=A0A0C5WZT5_NOCSI|nr:putative conserved transmembrane transport protein [Pimelobacter simplex]
MFIVNVALDDIGRDLGEPDLGALSWILNGYAVTFAALLVPLGRVADRRGRKNVFVIGMALFTAASLGAGLAPDVWTLVGSRVVQAVGAAAMMPASLGLLVAAAPPEKRAAVARLWALVGAVSAAVGPSVGGVLVQLSWEWAFWINVPAGLLLIALAVRYVPDLAGPAAAGSPDGAPAPRPDVLGAVLLATSVGALVLALVQADSWGWTSARVGTALAVAVVAAGGVRLVAARHPAPVVDPHLFRNRRFTLANLSTIVFNMGFAMALLAGILWMQRAWGYSPLRTGLALTPGPLAVAVVGITAGRLFPRARLGHLIAAGSAIFAAGAVWQALVLSTEPSYVTGYLLPWITIGIAVGLVMPNVTAAAIADLPVADASTGSGIVTMARQVALALGVSVLVSLLGTSSGTLPGRAEFETVWWWTAGIAAVAVVVALAMEGRGGVSPAAPPSRTPPARRAASSR